ncbi:MAG: helix-turn-helix domain-containing protein [Rhodospirillales bacterium]|jgi:excisionase family DNA binding protein|nr:helix-turn-helix domain-containing protein [Rhodospirillales bacterium]MBT5351014.1 helix-turn-helix domain-containing protein [Rhodospirillales bacterium]MBT5519326.1 helix-turn-helix domain-containing protein [Rhodospirillales bacterium]MBT7371445.1 helix-turn-helix domain-containing protein [Gammaproteobacteria bacterium]
MPRCTPSPFLTIPDIAERLQVSDKTVRKWVKVGDLIAHLIGGQYRISEEDFSLFLRVRRGAYITDSGVQ